MEQEYEANVHDDIDNYADDINIPEGDRRSRSPRLPHHRDNINIPEGDKRSRSPRLPRHTDNADDAHVDDLNDKDAHADDDCNPKEKDGAEGQVPRGSDGGSPHAFDFASETMGGVVTVSRRDGQGVGDGLRESCRKRPLTVKGLAYLVSVKRKAVSTAVSKWRATAATANKTMTDTLTITSLKYARDTLEGDIVAVSTASHELISLLDDIESSPVLSKLEEIESENLTLLSKLTDTIRELQLEAGSDKSGKSRVSNASKSTNHSKRSKVSHRSKSSNGSCISISSSQARAEAAAEAAMLQARLKYIEPEANMKKDLEVLQTKKKLDMATARFNALTKLDEEEEILHTCDNSDLNPDASSFIPHNRRETKDNDQNKTSDTHTKQGLQLRVSTVQSPLIDNAEHHRQELSHLSEHASLARVLSEQLYLSRIPLPEPQLFTGDPLKFPAWKTAFNTLIGSKPLRPAEKVQYLRRYLGGRALEAVEGFLILSTDHAFEQAMALLEERYGRPFEIANAFRDKLDSWPKISSKDGVGLRQLGDFLFQCAAAMTENSNLNILNDERENKKVLVKLPDWLVARWGRQVRKSRKENGCFPPFSSFVNFIHEEAEIANDPVTGLSNKGNSMNINNEQKQSDEKRLTRVFATEASELRTVSCCYCQASTHDLNGCEKFKESHFDDRDQFVKEHALCFGCLQYGHKSLTCKQRLVCDICQKYHPTCLHRESRFQSKPESKHGEVKHAFNKSVYTDKQSTSLSSMILPVMISHTNVPGKEVRVYAMLDTQSDTTFISEDVYRTLGVTGTPTQLSLSTMTSTAELVNADRIEGLAVRGVGLDTHISLPATYTCATIPADLSHIPGPEVARKWPHLKCVADKLMPVTDHPIGLLIGYNCPEALAPQDVILPRDSGPYAQRTELGWSIIGCSSPDVNNKDFIGVSCQMPQNSTTPFTSTQIVLRTRVQKITENKAQTEITKTIVAGNNKYLEVSDCKEVIDNAKEGVERTNDQELKGNPEKISEVEDKKSRRTSDRRKSFWFLHPHCTPFLLLFFLLVLILVSKGESKMYEKVIHEKSNSEGSANVSIKHMNALGSNHCRGQWRCLQNMINEFWNRWKHEYVQQLQQRQRWNTKQTNLNVGNIVLVKDEDVTCCDWKVGRITKTISAKDNLVRRVEVLIGDKALDQTGHGLSRAVYIERPVQKLVLLMENDGIWE